MVSAEATPLYDRTLVSKELLSGDAVDGERLPLQPPESYEDASIDLRLGVGATALDLRARRVDLADGSQLPHDRLVRAVGGEPVDRRSLTTSDGGVAIARPT
jgi:NADPH-dependent 2,4-dienoyl-CoA reductase/sulfur reductase-like enzyme